MFDENGNPVEDKIVSFIGVAPIDDPKYVVLVALDTPNYVAGTSYTPHNQYISGGLMAAPTVRDVFPVSYTHLDVYKRQVLHLHIFMRSHHNTFF